MLKEIVDKLKGLNIYEERSLDDKYCEFVFYTKDTGEWAKVLTDIFGPAVKPSGIKPTKDDFKLTDDYGGIYDTQTLFKKELDNKTVIAMFWPWQNGICTTLKMAVLEEK